MRLALWQSTSPQGDLDHALAEVEAALNAAAAMGVAALVLPEVWLPGYNQPDVPARALALESPPLKRLGALARTARTALVVGYAERDGDAVYNSAACFSPDGALLANYRKVQLYGPRERVIHQPGTFFPTFQIGGETVTVPICYDVEFTPHIKTLADRGVTTILAPTAIMQPFTHVARYTVPAMAANHGVTIVYANYCGQESDLAYIENSLIAGPHGEILDRAGETPALLVADIRSRVSTQSADFRALKYARPATTSRSNRCRSAPSSNCTCGRTRTPLPCPPGRGDGHLCRPHLCRRPRQAGPCRYPRVPPRDRRAGPGQSLLP